MKNYFKITVFSLIVLISGCAGGQRQDTFLREVNIKDFEKTKTMDVEFRGDSLSWSVSVPTLPQVVQVNVPLNENILRVYYIKIKDNSGLNINRQLIYGKEVVFDEKKNIMKVQFDLPIIYFAEGNLNYDLEIFALNKNLRSKTVLNRNITFNWLPEISGTKVGNDYSESTSPFMELGPKDKAEYDKEIFNINLDRISDEYKEKIIIE